MRRRNEQLRRKQTRLKVVPPEGASRPVRIALPRGASHAARPGAAAQTSESAAGVPGVFVGTRYRLVRRLGEGGTGTVYEARDRILNMPIAIKVLNSGLCRDRNAIAALKEEARIAIRLAHTHIVRLYDLQNAGHRYFLVMEYVEGSSLRRIMECEGPLSPATVAQVIGVSAEALSYAHRHGVLHNDLKPDNLLLSGDGVLKLIDFGVACLIGSRYNSEWVSGTPAYMSPEQKRGETPDTRTDIFALGIIAYELLTGRTPFPAGASASELLGLDPGELSGVSDAVRDVLQKAVAARREERWATVEEFASALAEALGG